MASSFSHDRQLDILNACLGDIRSREPPSFDPAVRKAREQAAEDRAQRRKESNEQWLSQVELNHDIVARALRDDVAGVEKIPRGATAYLTFLAHLADLPLTSGARDADGNLVNDVRAKVLFAEAKADIGEYLATGAWSGTERRIGLTPDERVDEPSSRPKSSEFIVKPRSRSEAYGYYNDRHWKTSANIDRKKIKIARFDYVGHSSSWRMILEFGRKNAKGTVPGADLTLGGEELVGWLREGNPLSGDAVAVLWGCRLAEKNTDSVAAQLAAKGLFHRVHGATGRTTYSRVLAAGGVPELTEDATWTTLPERKKRAKP